MQLLHTFIQRTHIKYLMYTLSLLQKQFLKSEALGQSQKILQESSLIFPQQAL